MYKFMLSTAAALAFALPAASQEDVADDVIAGQRATLAASTKDGGFGPQSPRDIDSVEGQNDRAFGLALPFTAMNLCNIHFHESAEHKGGEFTTYAGNGDGKGYGSGYKYDGALSQAELTPIDVKVGASEHGDLVPGDTIEIHFVYSSARVEPGPTLDSCFSEAISNPDLRVEAVVAVLVNDPHAVDFTEMLKVESIGGLYQAPNLPTDLGAPVVYAGSTTGPDYNEKASPFLVTWGVRPRVAKVEITSVGDWLKGNVFEEDHAHGVRNLIINSDLLSPITN